MVKYMTYLDGKFTSYDNYPDFKAFIDKHKNCRYKKINSEEDIEHFKKNNEGKVYKSKIYVVIFNDKVEYFDNWAECKELIEKCPGCAYKSFENKKDVEEYVMNNTHNIVKQNDPDTLYADIKISFDEIKIKYIKNHIIIEEKKIKNNYKEVVAQIIACEDAIKYAIDNKEERIIIKSDYPGLQMFAHKAWQAKSDITKKYVEKIDKYSKEINIDFI